MMNARLATYFALSCLALPLGCTLEESNTGDDDAGSAGTPASGSGGVHAGSGGVAGSTTAGKGGAATGGVSMGGHAGTYAGAAGSLGGSSSGSTAAGAGGTSGTAAGGAGTGGAIGQGGTSSGNAGTGGAFGGAGAGGTAPSGGKGGSDTGGSGGKASGGAGGSGSNGEYHPCPTNGDPCKILPLGDSITWGIQYDGAYRVELFTKAVTAGQNITFTGSLSNGPSMVANMPFPKSNEGHSGWTITQVAGLIPSPALMTIPNIVLLMIGTNDVYASSGQATMPDRLGMLVDKIIDAAPDALIVVAKITPLSNTSWNATIKTYNDAIPGIVDARAAAGKHVILGDMNTGFTSGMLSSDSIHPNQSGYDFMGDAWYSKIGSLLPMN